MDSTWAAIRRVFFDLDDTLCGYWDASKAGLRRTFELHGLDGYTPEEMVGHWANAFRDFSPTLKKTGWYQIYLKEGEPTRTEQMRLTLEALGIDDPDHARLLSDTYAQERDRHLELFPDATHVLGALGSRFPLGLITNGPADIQRQEIATLGIESYFDQIYIEGEMGRGKPLADVFAMITDAAGVQPHEIVMVGNSYLHDVKPAIEAGWKGIWIRRDSDVPPSAEPGQVGPEDKPAGDPEPTLTIRQLSELLPLFE